MWAIHNFLQELVINEYARVLIYIFMYLLFSKTILTANYC